MKLQREKMSGKVKTSFIEKVKKNSLRICLDVTALAGGIAIIWGTVRLTQCSKMMETASIEATTNIDDVEEYINVLNSKDKKELTKIDQELLAKYEIYKKLSEKNEEIKEKKDIEPDFDDKKEEIKPEEEIKDTKNEEELVSKTLEPNRSDSVELENPYLDFSDYSELIGDVGKNSQEYQDRLTSDLEGCFNDACSKRGIDSEILIAMGKQENGLLAKSTGSAAGMLQIEGVNKYNKYNAYNYIENENEYVDFAKMNLNGVDDNINGAAVMLQELIERYPNNIKIAIHAYNYGYPIIDRAIKNAIERTGKTKDQITYDDIKKYLEDVHNNPGKYMANWKNSTYGDGKYSTRVMSRVRKRLVYATIKQENNKLLIIYDMSSGEAIKKYTSNGLKSNVYYDKENHKYLKLDDIINSINPNSKKTKSF